MYIEWDTEKNEWLKRERGIGFEDILTAIDEGKILDILEHPNKEKYKEQYLLIVEINEYAYVVPFRKKKEKIRFITIFPSRKLTKKYLRR